MLCKNPFTIGLMAHGCGQCMPCRLNRRRLWTHRMMLEALVHPASSFVTLTYNVDNLPEGGTLVPRDMQLFMKRLRIRVPNETVRYFGVGEYGDFTQRPHYHLALFGIGKDREELVAAAWPSGFVYVGELTSQSAAYIAGYTTKKMTSKDDVRLHGRCPEFARMSLRPGIGALAIGQIQEALAASSGIRHLVSTGDVPGMLKHGQSSYPLGPYLRGKLRQAFGIEDGKMPDIAYEALQKEVFDVYADYRKGQGSAVSFKEMLQEESKQKILNMETRAKIHASKKGSGL